MSNNGPGHSHCKGISLIELAQRFPGEQTSAKWFESVFWADGRTCPRCEGDNTYATKGNTDKMPYRCRDCKRYFSVRTGTVLESSNLSLRKWVWAVFLEITSLRGVSSMKLRRGLENRQGTAWHLCHRIREGLRPEIMGMFEGLIEVDEAYLSGSEKNKHKDKKLNVGRGTFGKSAILVA